MSLISLFPLVIIVVWLLLPRGNKSFKPSYDGLKVWTERENSDFRHAKRAHR